jgi:myo-inositol-1-phosphate synthase
MGGWHDGRVGLWLIGARGSVATTAITGLLALQAGLVEPLGCVTERPPLAGLPLPSWDELVVGGHDLVTTPLDKRAEQLAEAGVIPSAVLAAVAAELRRLDGQLRQIDLRPDGAQREFADWLVAELADFAVQNRLARVVVVNLSSTEPPVPPVAEHAELALLERALDDPGRAVLPASSLAAYAAIRAGCSFVDFTPSPGISLPALDQLARQAGLPYAGRDGKTGETLLRTVLAPMFIDRALRVRAWAGTNLLGGGDGATLANADNVSSKLESKARGLASLLGEPVSAPLHIDNVPCLGEQKTAWDHIAFDGFLGARMTLQFTWTGLDSALAAPLVLDLARLLAAAHAAGRSGAQPELAFFFKDPLAGTDAPAAPDVPVGTDSSPVEHRFAEQARRLHAWAAGLAEPDRLVGPDR